MQPRHYRKATNMNPNHRIGPHASPQPSKLPATSAEDFERLASVLTVLAELAHERMTVRQALFFTSAAYLEAMGQTSSVPIIRDAVPVLKRAGEKIKETLLASTDRYPDALGWLEQETDPNDRRMRYLKLSGEGREIALALTDALHLR
jgi:hypothetical protein